MKIAVWDTYVPRANENLVMHFDILVPDGTTFQDVQRFGSEYLSSKGQSDQPFTPSECQFCHIEVASEEVLADIEASGYSIIEMEHCG